jgi:hypothetical protein
MPRTRYAKGHGAPGFPFETSVSYKVLGAKNLGQAGRGRTISISRRVVTFAADREIPNGVGLELAVDWPIQLPGYMMTKLMLCGVVISADPSKTTMEIVRHEFRMKLRGG